MQGPETERWAPRELVLSALEGDEEAKERLIAAVWPACFRLAATIIGDRNLAQDAAQEACVILYRKLSAMRRPEAFGGWLYRVVMHESARVRRKHSVCAEAYETLSDPPRPRELDVWRALAALPPKLRDVVVLFYFDDCATAHIAQILRIPHATVRTRLVRARERLRALLADYNDASGVKRLGVNRHAF